MTTATKYTMDDCGVYVDYAYQNADETCERVIGIAEDHGFKAGQGPRLVPEGFAEPYDAEWVSEVADEATTYMNNHYGVDGAYWAFDGDAGGWGLFAEDTEEMA